MSPQEIWHRFGGNQMGYAGNNGTLDTDYAASITNRTIAGRTVNPGAFRFGQHVGGAHANFDLSGERITSYDQGGVAGGYTVRQQRKLVLERSIRGFPFRSFGR